MDEVRKAGKEVSICEQWGLRAPLGAAELYREGSCCWRCLFPTTTTLMIHDTWSLPSLSRSTACLKTLGIYFFGQCKCIILELIF